MTIITVTLAEDQLDTREGEDVFLKCRFNEQHEQKEFTYYWARGTTDSRYENVAIGNTQLNTNYRYVKALLFFPQQKKISSQFSI